MNELITALRRDRMDEFKNRFRRIDVLIVDDVQFLAGRERTQEEFFHTFNSLYEGHRQIVLTSDKFPKEIPDLEERLRNRFEWGLIADIQPPDMETRVAILQKKAEAEGIDLPHDVALFLAIEHRLERARARRVADAARCLRLAQQVRDHRRLRQAGAAEHPAREGLDDHHRVDPEGDLRVLPHPPDRLALEETHPHHRRATTGRDVPLPPLHHASFPVIGDRFGGRDHSTVIHATQVVDQRIKRGPDLPRHRRAPRAHVGRAGDNAVDAACGSGCG